MKSYHQNIGVPAPSVIHVAHGPQWRSASSAVGVVAFQSPPYSVIQNGLAALA